MRQIEITAPTNRYIDGSINYQYLQNETRKGDPFPGLKVMEIGNKLTMPENMRASDHRVIAA